MSNSLFRSGGPYNIQKTGAHLYTFTIPIAPDELGRVARACPEATCSPGYFKVRLGTGITDGQEVAYCPYCRRADEPSGFMTPEQLRYGKEVMTREALGGLNQMMQKALGVNSSGTRKMGGGMFSMEMSFKPGRLPTVHQPFEDEVRRDVVCPHCGLDHAVFGIATWCADCGQDIFLTHVEAEYGVVRTMLTDVERRRELFGPRVAARDLENGLEDTVSIFEAVLKTFLRRHLRNQGKSDEEVQRVLKKVHVSFQTPRNAAIAVREHMAQELFDTLNEQAQARLEAVFEKRHPITHNLGVVDRKYMERVLDSEDEGREIRLSTEEILCAIDLCIESLKDLQTKVFPT